MFQARTALLLTVSLSAASPAAATRLPAIFGDHMVVQAGEPVPVWGWGDPGERVTVTFAGQRVTSVAASDGRWRVTLSPLKTSQKPTTFVVQGRDRIVYDDVLIGQVWLASGQSNMEKPLGEQRGQKPTFDADAEIAAAWHPTLRLFAVTNRHADRPADDVEGHWMVSSPESVVTSRFSAAGYYFGRRLTRVLDEPVGVIDSTVGGTQIEPWTPPDEAAGRDAKASHLWNAMIAPLAPTALAGVIWYQGEGNIVSGDSGAVYADRTRALIEGWRKAFGRTLPFYTVQIAPFRYTERYTTAPLTPTSAADLRAGQAAAARAIPNSGIVLTSDLVDDLGDIHPRDKKSVGERLADLALARTYGRNLVVDGPTLSSARANGTVVTVRFDNAHGLRTRGGDTPGGFAVAGSDGTFYPVQTARIEGDSVVLSSSRVAQPVTVRMGWSDVMGVNLENNVGLPALSFTTRIAN